MDNLRLYQGAIDAAVELARREREGRSGALDAHLIDHAYLQGESCTIADISNFAYTHVAGDAGYELAAYPAVTSWLSRVEGQPGFLDDLLAYPENALPGRGTSIYDR